MYFDSKTKGMKLSHSIVLRQIFVQIFIIHIYNEDNTSTTEKSEIELSTNDKDSLYPQLRDICLDGKLSRAVVLIFSVKLYPCINLHDQFK